MGVSNFLYPVLAAALFTWIGKKPVRAPLGEGSPFNIELMDEQFNMADATGGGVAL